MHLLYRILWMNVTLVKLDIHLVQLKVLMYQCQCTWLLFLWNIWHLKPDTWARNRTVTSVYSEATITEPNPFVDACKAWSSNLVSASSWDDFNSLTSSHPLAVIIKQSSSQVTYNCLVPIEALYLGCFHSLTKNWIRVFLVFRTIEKCPPLLNAMPWCYVFELCTIGWSPINTFSIFDWTFPVNIKHHVDPTTVSTFTYN